jgi:hypothetical protein
MLHCKNFCYCLGVSETLTFKKSFFQMTSLFFASLLLLITLPLVILLYITESRSTRINRLKRNGATWKAIGQRYSVSATTARRWSFA